MSNKIKTIAETEKFLILSRDLVDGEKLIKLAESYDQYVGARELDYMEGVKNNKRIIEDMKDLGVDQFVIKDYTPMFSNSKSDWRLI